VKVEVLVVRKGSLERYLGCKIWFLEESGCCFDSKESVFVVEGFVSICGKGAQDNWFDCRLHWRVGDGRNVRIWEDRWVEGQVLKETFPRLFLISQCKDSLVGDLADLGHVRSGRCYNWNLDWRRERCEWEKRLEVQLLDMVSRVHWSIEGQDGLLWEGNNQKAYTVKFGYSVLNREDLMHTPEVFRLLWGLKIAPSAIICAWRLLFDRLPTRVNLARREIQVGNMCCPLCSGDIETAQHLFSTCRVAQNIWD